MRARSPFEGQDGLATLFRAVNSFCLPARLTFSSSGGPSPLLAKTETFRNLKGAVDNVRVWWPPCPHELDPTRCNPYGFLYPQRIDGSRQPASSIDDSLVTLAHVALPILTHMFGLAPGDTVGLIAQFSFDDDVSDGLVSSSSSWQAQACSTGGGSAVCAGCNEECVFDKCSLFDADCGACFCCFIVLLAFLFIRHVG